MQTGSTLEQSDLLVEQDMTFTMCLVWQEKVSPETACLLVPSIILV